MKNINRRNFVKNTSVGSIGAAALGFSNLAYADKPKTQKDNVYEKPREVWIAAMTKDDIEGKDIKETIQAALRQMENAVPFKPDIYCLPETFLDPAQRALPQNAEDGTGKIAGPFQEFAKKHNCYIICPINTVENGKYYNAAVLIDRSGKMIGQYRKCRITESEVDEVGLTPGPIDPPVFKTDFGTIGIQICFDIEWPEGWRQLAKKGAEIVFWPSAFAAGKKLNTKAWENQYCVVSSTLKNTTKIVDITGEDVATSGNWSRWGVCAPVNLEKAFLASWPYVQSFPDIQKKYGRKIRISSLHEEEFSVIESLSADVKIADVMKEFKLKSYREHLLSAENKQAAHRI
jgi:predicted amidohydrolase